MADQQTSAAYAIRRFSDASTGKRYPMGAIITDLTVGRFINLKAGGVVRAATPEEVAAGGPPAEPAPPQHPRAISTPPPPPPAPKAPRKPRAKKGAATKTSRRRKAAT